ncbi:MAG: MFS transporter [Bacillota bacterium]|nr:MFS transporter [Bacillota bacterium]
MPAVKDHPKTALSPAIICLLLAYLLSIMNMTSIKVLLPAIMTDLGLELNWLTWVVNAYTLPVAALTPLAGRIGDVVGPRRFFLGGIFVLAIGSLICGVSPTISWLIAGRIMQAVGAALLVPTGLALMMAKTEENKRGRLLGLWGSMGGVGAVTGPVVSGLLAELFSWREPFIVIALFALLIALLSWTLLKTEREPSPAGRENGGGFDSPGAATLIFAVFSLLMGITLLPDWGWENNWIRLSLILFVILLYVFYRIEKKSAAPLLDPKLMGNPSFSLGLLTVFLEQFAVAGTFFVMPIFLGSVHGYGAGATALLLTPVSIVIALAAPLGGRLSDRYGPGLPIVFGMLVRAASFIVLAWITVDTAYSSIAIWLALNGLGFALTSTPALHAVLSSVRPSQHGVASGVHNMLRFTGSAIGTTVAGIVLYALIPSSFAGLLGPLPGFHEAYLVEAVACLLGVGVGILLIRNSAKKSQ